MNAIELAVMMPIYNEEVNIEAVVAEWVEELSRLGITHTVLAVNDGSRDGTEAALKRLAAKYPEVTAIEKQNAGHGQACRTGYFRAVECGVAWTLQIDSDGQCDPRFFASFWKSRDEADAIFGMRKSRDDGASRALVSTICRWATSALCGIDLKDSNVPYRLMRTSCLAEALGRIPADFEMQNVALTLALKRNRSVRWKYIPIHFRDRQGGTNSINFKRIVRMGGELLLNLHRIGK